MKERPILFSTPMVKAILAGQKTMTRRVAKFVPLEGKDIYQTDAHSFLNLTAKGRYPLPFVGRFTSPNKMSAEHLSEDLNLAFGNNGDRLWVREAFAEYKIDKAMYKANYGDTNIKWKPGIFMRRKLSRITLEITNQRIERLNALKDEDAKAEGFSSVEEFKELWDKLNAKRGYGWDVNPWVWVISFKRVEAA
jgi:hypothetical protein